MQYNRALHLRQVSHVARMNAISKARNPINTIQQVAKAAQRTSSLAEALNKITNTVHPMF